MIKRLYFVTLLICAIPFIPGLLGLIVPALSWLPSLGMDSPNLAAFSLVANWPGLMHSILLTLITGLGSTALATFICFIIIKQYWNSIYWQRIELSLSPLLAIPHIAFAIGFSFTFSSTGWLFRVFESWGFDTQGLFSIIRDQYGIGLMLALAIKELPFLLLMSVAVLQQIKVKQLLAVSSGLGYSEKEGWLKVILPQWLPTMRLPIFAVAAYGTSVVDVALILGPSRPATLAVQVWQWFNDPDLTLLPRAAVGAMTILAVSLFVLMVIRTLEWFTLQYCRQWQIAGTQRNKTKSATLRVLTKYTYLLYLPIIIVSVAVIPLLFVWSFAQRWRFPDLFPSSLSLRFWQQELMSLFELSFNSISLALISSLFALVMVIICLEYRQKFNKSLPSWLIAFPLILPQLSLLFGLQISTYFVNGDFYWLWVAWSHLFFVFPYLYLALDGPWKNYDVRLDQSARSLGLSGWETWWRVKWPLLLPAILLGLAVGISTSLAQYLPTQMLGAGRISTITTEAVALASGQDRRVTAVYGLLQGVLPLIFFTLAIFSSRYFSYCHRNPKLQRSTTEDELSYQPPHYQKS